MQRTAFNPYSRQTGVHSEGKGLSYKISITTKFSPTVWIQQLARELEPTTHLLIIQRCR